MRISLLWCGLLLMGRVAIAAEARVGVFDVDASPPVGSMMAYDKTAEVLVPLSCRGVVLLGAEQPIVLCAIDWIGVGNAAHREFCEALAAAVETSADRVAVHAIHQHDAPWCDFSIDALCEREGVEHRPFDSPFAREVIRRAAEAAKKAKSNAMPITHVGMSAANVEQVASNRRILGSDGKVQHVRWSATKEAAVRDYPEGTIDPAVRTIRFWNGEKPVAALTYYAAHPQSYYRTGKANPDFPGLARNQRQQETGVPHIHFNGAGGNITAGKYNDGSPANRQVLADRMAAGMRKAWEGTERTPIQADQVGWTSIAVKLPAARHLDPKGLLATLRDPRRPAMERFIAANKLAFVERLETGESLPIGCLALGNARVLHMPGELFVEYQLVAQRMRPDRFVAMAAYGDYGPAYIGTAVSYSQGGYETGPDASFVDARAEPILLDAMSKLLDVDSTQPQREK